MKTQVDFPERVSDHPEVTDSSRQGRLSLLLPRLKNKLRDPNVVVPQSKTRDSLRDSTLAQKALSIGVLIAGLCLLPQVVDKDGTLHRQSIETTTETTPRATHPTPAPKQPIKDAMALASSTASFEAIERAQATFHEHGKFVIHLYDRPIEYLICHETERHTVQFGESTEGLANKNHVHYLDGGERKPVWFLDMVFAIEQHNPNTSYGYSNGPLQTGEILTLPVDGTCTTTYENAPALILASKNSS